MKFRLCLALALVFLGSQAVSAADHRLEPLDEPAPADALSSEIAATLSPKGFKIIRGTSRTVAEFWLCKELAANPAATQTSGVQYPFEQGQLIGVVRYPRKGAEFRDQDIAAGVYTLRYGLQPVDGAHVGTFPTRDFLVLSKAEDDKSPDPVDIKTLTQRGATAAETNHPGILALIKAEGKPESYPTLVHNEEEDWWIARLEVQTKAGDKTEKLPVDLVVVGVAGE